MPGLTAKVFRTFNASFTFQQELKKTPMDGTVAEKILAYNRANRQVAVLCNHQRAVPKTHGTQMEKLSDKILGLKYEKRKIKEQMIELDPTLKKLEDIKESESDLDDEFIQRYEKQLEEKKIEKLEKQLIKENEKRAEQGQSPLKSLPEAKKKSIPSLEVLEKKLKSMTDRISNQKLQLVDKDENKQTALGTSKINYIDPRITASWCKKYDVPIEKMFNQSLREKFRWAMQVDESFEF